MLIYKKAVLLMHLQTNLVKGSCRKVQLFNDGGLRIASNCKLNAALGPTHFQPKLNQLGKVFEIFKYM